MCSDLDQQLRIEPTLGFAIAKPFNSSICPQTDEQLINRQVYTSLGPPTRETMAVSERLQGRKTGTLPLAKRAQGQKRVIHLKRHNEPKKMSHVQSNRGTGSRTHIMLHRHPDAIPLERPPHPMYNKAACCPIPALHKISPQIGPPSALITSMKSWNHFWKHLPACPSSWVSRHFTCHAIEYETPIPIMPMSHAPAWVCSIDQRTSHCHNKTEPEGTCTGS
jgi:hypothetical protein